MTRWVDDFFASNQAGNGGVIRRSLDDVEFRGAYEEIVERARDNGWHVVETGGQLVVLCHPGAMHIHC